MVKNNADAEGTNTRLDTIITRLDELKTMMMERQAAGGGSSKAGGSTKRVKKDKPAKDPNAPNKPATAFILFINDPEAKREYEKTIDGGVEGADLRKKVRETMTAAWKEDDDIKAKWKEIHARRMKEYATAMAKYEASKEDAAKEPEPQEENTPSDTELASVLNKRRGASATSKGKGKAKASTTASVAHLSASESE